MLSSADETAERHLSEDAIQGLPRSLPAPFPKPIRVAGNSEQCADAADYDLTCAPSRKELNFVLAAFYDEAAAEAAYFRATVHDYAAQQEQELLLRLAFESRNLWAVPSENFKTTHRTPEALCMPDCDAEAYLPPPPAKWRKCELDAPALPVPSEAATPQAVQEIGQQAPAAAALAPELRSALRHPGSAPVLRQVKRKLSVNRNVLRYHVLKLSVLRELPRAVFVHTPFRGVNTLSTDWMFMESQGQLVRRM